MLIKVWNTQKWYPCSHIKQSLDGPISLSGFRQTWARLSVLQAGWTWSSIGLKATQVYELLSKASQLGHSVSTASWFLNQTYSEQMNLDLLAPSMQTSESPFLVNCFIFHSLQKYKRLSQFLCSVLCLLTSLCVNAQWNTKIIIYNSQLCRDTLAPKGKLKGRLKSSW